MKVNPNAVMFVSLGAGVGYLISGSFHGAVWGFVVTGTISFISAFFQKQ